MTGKFIHQVSDVGGEGSKWVCDCEHSSGIFTGRCLSRPRRLRPTLNPTTCGKPCCPNATRDDAFWQQLVGLYGMWRRHHPKDPESVPSPATRPRWSWSGSPFFSPSVSEGQYLCNAEGRRVREARSHSNGRRDTIRYSFAGEWCSSVPSLARRVRVWRLPLVDPSLMLRAAGVRLLTACQAALAGRRLHGARTSAY